MASKGDGARPSRGRHRSGAGGKPEKPGAAATPQAAVPETAPAGAVPEALAPGELVGVGGTARPGLTQANGRPATSTRPRNTPPWSIGPPSMRSDTLPDWRPEPGSFGPPGRRRRGRGSRRPVRPRGRGPGCPARPRGRGPGCPARPSGRWSRSPAGPRGRGPGTAAERPGLAAGGRPGRPGGPVAAAGLERDGVSGRGRVPDGRPAGTGPFPAPRAHAERRHLPVRIARRVSAAGGHRRRRRRAGRGPAAQPRFHADHHHRAARGDQAAALQPGPRRSSRRPCLAGWAPRSSSAPSRPTTRWP